MRMGGQKREGGHIRGQLGGLLESVDLEKYGTNYAEHRIKSILTAAKDINLKHPKS